MTKSQKTKRALLASALSLIMCFTMLLGTTYAWFTDSVTSDVNKIIAGNLDVEVYTDDGMSIQNVDTLFNDVTLWEPGAVAYENLTVANLGTLALKYNLMINFNNANYVIRGDKAYSLDQVLKVAVVPGGVKKDTNLSRDALVAGISNWTSLVNWNDNGSLTAAGTTGDKATYGIVIWWEPSDADNNWNINNGAEVSDYAQTGKNELHIDLGVALVATQYTSEEDSFGSDYDKGAAWTGAIDKSWYNDTADTFVINTAEELAGFAALVNGNGSRSNVTKVSFKGKTVKLGANINLNGVAWTPINGFGGTFDGDGHIISGLNVNGVSNVGFFTGINVGTTIKNVTFDGAKVVGNHYVGVIVGWEGNESGFSDIVNCHVVNSQVICDTDSSLDNGDKAGGIAGYAVTLNITECTVKNTIIKAYRDFGGILGYANRSTKVSGCATDNVELIIDNDVNYKNYTKIGEHDANQIVGEASANAVITGNITSVNGKSVDVVMSAEALKDFMKGAEAGDSVYLASGDYSFPASSFKKGVTLVCEEGVVFENGAKLNINGATVVGATFESVASYNTVNGIYKDCTFNGSNALRYGYAGETVVFENCVFNGRTYGVHFDGGANEVVFKNCTLSGFNALGGAITKLTMEGCTFKALGKSGYNGINLWGDTEMISCTFVFDGSVANEWVDLCNDGKTVKFTNCVVTDGETNKSVATVVGDYGEGNTIIVDGALLQAAGSQDELNTAVSANNNVSVNLNEGNYTLPSVTNGDVTISGTKDTVITVNKPAYHGSDVTLNGVTVKGSGYSTGIQHVNTVTYNNAIIDGEMCLYGEKVVFNNCTFNLGKGQYIWTYGAKEAEFIGCTFNTAGKAILVYNEGAGASKVTVKGCTFKASAGDKAGAIANQNCAAIEIDNYQSSGTGAAHVLITEGNTYDSDFSGEWRIKNFVNGNAITVNGETYTSIAIDGKVMTIDDSKNVTVK